MKKKSTDFFWASYADFMTAMFIIALVLFVLSYTMFRTKEAAVTLQADQLAERGQLLAQKEAEIENMNGSLRTNKQIADSLLQALEDERGRLLVLEVEYRKLKEMEDAIAKLNPEYFVYQPKFKRHILKTDIQFEAGHALIRTKYHKTLKASGLALQQLFDSLKNGNIKYMLVIEGSASKDGFTRNYQLSYERALQLFKFWKRQGITFDPNICEVMISGSGSGGIGRAKVEKKNQRFLLQIIPKVGTIKLPDLSIINEINQKVLNENKQDSLVLNK